MNQEIKGVANLSTIGDPDKVATPHTCSPIYSLIKKGDKAQCKSSNLFRNGIQNLLPCATTLDKRWIYRKKDSLLL